MSGDTILQRVMGQQVHDLPIDRVYSAASDVMPVDYRTPQGEWVRAMPHQRGGTENQQFLTTFSAKTVNANGFLNYTNQDAAALVAQFEITELPRTYITELWLKWEFTWPTDSGNTGITQAPGPTWIDRVAFSQDSTSNPFQNLYGELILRFMIMSLTPEKLYHYAFFSGGWINPNYAQDTVHTYAAAAVWRSEPLASNGIRFYPFQLKPVAATQTEFSADPRSAFSTICFPLVGSFVQQAGVFCADWIEGGRLYISVYGEPSAYMYSTSAAACQAALVNGSTRFLVIAKCFTTPIDDPIAKKLATVNESKGLKGGIHVQIMEYMRACIPTTIGNSATINVSLNAFSGRHLAFIIAKATPTKTLTSTTGGQFWKFGKSPSNPYPLPTESCSTFPFKNFAGSQTSGGVPTYDLVDAYGSALYCSGVTQLTWEENLAMLIGPKCVTNPYILGLTAGGPCYSPFAYTDIPIFIGNPINAIQGLYDGSVELPANASIRIKTGADADTAMNNVDVYVGAWRTLHISKDNGRIIQEQDPPMAK